MYCILRHLFHLIPYNAEGIVYIFIYLSGGTDTQAVAIFLPGGE